MDSLCEHETFKSICNLCHRDNVITTLRAENERLRAALLGEETDHSRRIMEVDLLRAENERLRAALLPFASIKADDGHDYISSWPDTVIVRCEASVRELKAARAALGEK